MITGRSTVKGCIPNYAGGAIQAKFVRQGGGVPDVKTATAAIDGAGNFEIQVWDNTHKMYAPSQTVFLIEAGVKTHYSATMVVGAQSPNGPADISSIFGAAPKP
jgi:hypothetical protein